MPLYPGDFENLTFSTKIHPTQLVKWAIGSDSKVPVKLSYHRRSSFNSTSMESVDWGNGQWWTRASLFWALDHLSRLI